jgi:putative nucleotidyltransferase with HDIG domain
MNRQIQLQRSAELLGLKSRWVLLAVAPIMGLSYFTEIWFAVGLGLFALSNFVAFRLCANDEIYLKLGRRFTLALRAVDVVAVTWVSFYGPFKGDNLWLLVIPTVLSGTLIDRSLKAITVLTVLASIIPLTNLLQSKSDPLSLACVACTVVAALIGLILSTYRERDEVLKARDARLDTLLNCATALAASTDLRSMILHTLKSSVHELDAICGYVMLTDNDNREELYTEVAYSKTGEFEFPEGLDIGLGVTGYAVKMGQPIAIHNNEDEHVTEEGIAVAAKSIVSVPLVARNYMGPAQASTELVQGAITLLGHSENSFSNPDDMQLLRSLAALVAEAVANARMEERQRTTFLKTLETLAKSLEARDTYTRGHSQRVCELSLMIGEQLGLSPEALEELRVGTILHDIGKIGVPDAILNKPARLTDEEFAVMKSHPVIGYEICKPLMLSEGVLMIIRNHHEKLDGRGYPDGLKGGELPLSLRIVCVADAFDAMSSSRPYRDVMDMSRVLGELSAGAGVQFDPVVVETLKDLLPGKAMQELYRGQWESPEERAA